MSKVAPRLLKHFYKRPEPICVGNVSSLDSNLTANLTHVSLNPPVQKSFPGVRSQGSTRATLLSDTPPGNRYVKNERTIRFGDSLTLWQLHVPHLSVRATHTGNPFPGFQYELYQVKLSLT